MTVVKLQLEEGTDVLLLETGDALLLQVAVVGGGVADGGGGIATRFVTVRPPGLPSTKTLVDRNNFPEPPDSWPGSRPEWFIFRALEALKVDFTYQSNRMGGRLDKGGAVLDFFIPSLGLGINVQSLYWHYGRLGGAVSDNLQRIALEGQGIVMIYIDEESAISNPIWYTQEALQFRDHSQMTRG